MLALMAVCQSFRMTGIKREQAQQFREYFPAVRHHKILAGDEQVQTGCIVPGPRTLAGMLAVNADLEAKRAGSTFPSRSGSPGADPVRGLWLVCSPVQPAQDQGKYGIQPRQGKNFRQDRVWNLRKFKAAALQRRSRCSAYI
ncbi:hypothetical protein JSMCR1_p228 (plasmid) [Escherichia coli]|nr:hypothetical protein JSMCR1_p228 [Escherichia coli]